MPDPILYPSSANRSHATLFGFPIPPADPPAVPDGQNIFLTTLPEISNTKISIFPLSERPYSKITLESFVKRRGDGKVRGVPTSSRPLMVFTVRDSKVVPDALAADRTILWI